MIDPVEVLIRNVEIDGLVGLDVRIAGGHIVEIGPCLRGGEADIDGAGGALLPGLIDHHIHLFSLAAEAGSIDLRPEHVTSGAALAKELRAASALLKPGEWLRGTGYHEATAGLLDRYALDQIVAERPLRIQSRTGGLWTLNSVAVERLLGDHEVPKCVERDERGAPTGRVWRGDDWLRARLADTPPSLVEVSAKLARFGVVAVTDASATNDQGQAELFSASIGRGELRQRLTMMSGCVEPPVAQGVRIGPVKVLLDDNDLPDLDATSAMTGEAHASGRTVAMHCVAAGELAFALAAFRTAGAISGDRIEHGGIIHPGAAAEIAELGLTVVTQPSFIRERGDRYLADVDRSDLPFLYPCASLHGLGIRVAGSSDAPYSSADPWAAMAAAIDRVTRSGQPLGVQERVTPRRALNMYLGGADDPGGQPRMVAPGAVADLCVLRAPLASALAHPTANQVAATVIGGRVVYEGS